MSIPQSKLYFTGVLTFKGQTNLAPQYICDLLSKSNSIHTYSTRLSSSGGLNIPLPRLTLFIQSFEYSAPVLWNSLPRVILMEHLQRLDVIVFISHLKLALPNVFFIHCVIHRQHLTAKQLTANLHQYCKSLLLLRAKSKGTHCMIASFSNFMKKQ